MLIKGDTRSLDYSSYGVPCQFGANTIYQGEAQP